MFKNIKKKKKEKKQKTPPLNYPEDFECPENICRQIWISDLCGGKKSKIHLDRGRFVCFTREGNQDCG